MYSRRYDECNCILLNSECVGGFHLPPPITTPAGVEINLIDSREPVMIIPVQDMKRLPAAKPPPPLLSMELHNSTKPSELYPVVAPNVSIVGESTNQDNSSPLNVFADDRLEEVPTPMTMTPDSQHLCEEDPGMTPLRPGKVLAMEPHFHINDPAINRSGVTIVFPSKYNFLDKFVSTAIDPDVPFVPPTKLDAVPRMSRQYTSPDRENEDSSVFGYTANNLSKSDAQPGQWLSRPIRMMLVKGRGGSSMYQGSKPHVINRTPTEVLSAPYKLPTAPKRKPSKSRVYRGAAKSKVPRKLNVVDSEVSECPESSCVEEEEDNEEMMSINSASGARANVLTDSILTSASESLQSRNYAGSPRLMFPGSVVVPYEMKQMDLTCDFVTHLRREIVIMENADHAREHVDRKHSKHASSINVCCGCGLCTLELSTEEGQMLPNGHGITFDGESV